MAFRCPSCESSLQKSSFDGLPVYRCNNCLGYLIGTKRVQVIETREFQVSQKLMDEASNAGPSDNANRVRCPHCLRRMEKKPYRKMTEFNIDVCKKCEVIWFDAGEIETIQLKFRDVLVAEPENRKKVDPPTPVENMTIAQREAFEKQLAGIYKGGKRQSLDQLVNSLNDLT